MTAPLLSIIIPVHNAEPFLERCLDSVCAQAGPPREVICVDDCSTDRSVEILKKYVDRFPFVRLIVQDMNQGESVTRNRGVREAQGEYLGFVDDDDAVDPDFFERLCAKAVATSADIVKGEAKTYFGGSDGLVDGMNRQIRDKGRFAFLYHWWTAIYRHRLAVETGARFPEDCLLGGDLVFQNLLLSHANALATVDGVFYHYYRRVDSGDSVRLSAAKIVSALRCYQMIATNMNAVHVAERDQTGYNLVYASLIAAAEDLFARGDDAATRRLCAQQLLQLYRQCANAVALNDVLYRREPYLVPFLVRGNVDSLADFLSRTGSIRDRVVASLRGRFVRGGLTR